MCEQCNNCGAELNGINESECSCNYFELSKTLIMKQITTSKGSYIFVEIDNNGTILWDIDFRVDCEILCTTDTITEEIAKGVVESYEQPIGWRSDEDKSKMSKLVLYRNYLLNPLVPVCMLVDTALDSFNSLLQSHNLSPDKTYAICKQN